MNIPERVEEIERNIEYVVSNPDRYDASAQVKDILTTALTETDQQAREEERDKVKSLLHQLHLCAIGKYEGDALENVKMQIAELQDALSNPPSQV